MHVLIAGAGVVGLTIAQGCRQHNIPFTIFEKDESCDSRSQGWSLTIHWALRSLRRTLGPELANKLPEATVDPTLKLDAGNFLFLNAETGDIRYRVPPAKERFRLDRLKFRSLLSTGVDVHWGKEIVSHNNAPDGNVTVSFKDGSTATGSILVGADGIRSKVRNFMFPENNRVVLNKLPINLIGAVRHFTSEEGAAVQALDPLLFFAMHPKTSTFMWYSVQQVYIDNDGKKSWDALVLISWLVKDKEKDSIPETKPLMVADMKRRAEGFSEPFKSMVRGIPENLDHITPLSLVDFSDIDWTTQDKVTLAGDSAHAMTMYRGEGANHGILDAALLVDQFVRIRDGQVSQSQALIDYENEMKARCKPAVLKSRQAALDGHCWSDINDDSPLIGGRIPPPTA